MSRDGSKGVGKVTCFIKSKINWQIGKCNVEGTWGVQSLIGK